MTKKQSLTCLSKNGILITHDKEKKKMSKWVWYWDDETFESEEKAREDVKLNVGYENLKDQVDYEISLLDIIHELQRLDSPLFWRLYEKTVDAYFEDFYYEIYDEDEEEEEED